MCGTFSVSPLLVYVAKTERTLLVRVLRALSSGNRCLKECSISHRRRELPWQAEKDIKKRVATWTYVEMLRE